jgi:hypothetical protein
MAIPRSLLGNLITSSELESIIILVEESNTLAPNSLKETEVHLGAGLVSIWPLLGNTSGGFT